MKTKAMNLAALALLTAMAATPARAQGDESWSGFHAGVQLGGARERLRVQADDTLNQLTNIDPPGAQPLTVVPGLMLASNARGRDTSLTYGALVGWQFQTGNVVLGLEGDLRSGRSSVDAVQTFALVNTALSPAASATVARSARTRYEWSARARLGIASGNMLFYGTAGIAGARVRLRYASSFDIPAGNAGSNGNIIAFPAQGPFVVEGSGSGNLVGWTGGLGIEHRLGRHVRIGLEGRYTDYGSKTVDMPDATRTGTGTLAAAPFTARTDEGVYPGATRTSLRDAQVNVRLIFAF